MLFPFVYINQNQIIELIAYFQEILHDYVNLLCININICTEMCATVTVKMRRDIIVKEM